MSIENSQFSDQKKRLSRRDFLRLSSSVVGMAALAACAALDGVLKDIADLELLT